MRMPFCPRADAARRALWLVVSIFDGVLQPRPVGFDNLAQLFRAGQRDEVARDEHLAVHARRGEFDFGAVLVAA